MKQLLIIIFFAVLYLGCGEERNKPFCLDGGYEGKFQSSDSTAAFFSKYKNAKRVVFRDSVQKEIVLDITYSSTYDRQDVQYSSTCANTIYSYDIERIVVDAKNLAADKAFEFVAYAEVSVPTTSADRDESISVKEYSPVNPKLYGYRFRKFLFYVQRYKKTQISSSVIRKSLTHNNVIYNDLIVDNQNPKCYLDKSVGIRAFRDFEDKLWFFDRFE